MSRIISNAARPDGERIFELIRQRDPSWGAVTRFADRVGCKAQTLRNLKAPGKGASLDLLFRIATALGVEITQIIRAGDTPRREQARPRPEQARPLRKVA